MRLTYYADRLYWCQSWINHVTKSGKLNCSICMEFQAEVREVWRYFAELSEACMDDAEAIGTGGLKSKQVDVS